jgi:lipopolysaccharide biosynthesis regulator YciM
MPEWYRNKTWSKDIEEMFFNKLNRARKDGRDQYLKIQAIELIETQEDLLLDIAETLLNKMLLEYPEDNFEKSSALKSLGDIYKLKADPQKAMEYYRRSVDFEDIYPRVLTQSYLEYAELVVIHKKVDHYPFIEDLLLKRSIGSIFSIEKYKVYTILTVLNLYKKDTEKAKQFQILADENANAQTSGLRYHKYLGVLKQRDSILENIIDRLKK